MVTGRRVLERVGRVLARPAAAGLVAAVREVLVRREVLVVARRGVVVRRGVVARRVAAAGPVDRGLAHRVVQRIARATLLAGHSMRVKGEGSGRVEWCARLVARAMAIVQGGPVGPSVVSTPIVVPGYRARVV